MCQSELETERNELGNPGVLKATSGNAAKRWKMRQETRATTKSAEAAIKQIATQKFQAEKERMREWKQVVMQEVARELHAIRKAHEEAMEAMEARKYGFQIELEKVKEELHRVESRSTTLEYEMNTLKAQKQTPEQRLTQNTSATKNTPIIPSSIKPLKGKEPTDPPRKSYAQMAASSSPKSLRKRLGQKLLVVVEDGKQPYQVHQSSSQKKEG